MKQLIHLVALISLIFPASTLFAQNSSDPFADFVTPPLEEAKEIPEEAKTIYPKFDSFLQSRLNFSVPIVTVEGLKDYKKERKPVYILDARGETAYKTSHIPGAKRVGFDDFSIEKVWHIPRDANVVVYCTTGVQSEKIGEYLETMGFTHVENLYGSIIEWVNEDGVVVDKDGHATQKVIVKDKQRKDFLKKGKAIILGESEIQ